MSFLEISDLNFEDDDNFLESCGVAVKKDGFSVGTVEKKVLNESLPSENVKNNTPFGTSTLNIFEKFKYLPKSSSKEVETGRNQSTRQNELVLQHSQEMCNFKNSFERELRSKNIGTTNSKGNIDVKIPATNCHASSALKKSGLFEDTSSFDILFEDDGLDEFTGYCKKPTLCTQQSKVDKNPPSKQLSQALLIRPSYMPMDTEFEETSSSPFITSISSSNSGVTKELNNFNTPCRNTSPDNVGANYISFVSKKVRKRKFPGPAGLLPDLPSDADLSILKNPESTLSSLYFDYSHDQEILCSQASAEEFQNAAWQNMLMDLSKEINLNLMGYYNIQNVMNKAKRKKLPKHVVADMLSVILLKITMNGQEADATFKDETGEIDGKIHNAALSLYKEHLVPHAVIVLKKVTFLFNQLIIKPQNIVRIYDSDGKMYHVSSFDANLEVAETSFSKNPDSIGTCNAEKANQNYNAMFPTTCDKGSKQLSDVYNLSQKELDDLLQNVDNSFFEDE